MTHFGIEIHENNTFVFYNLHNGDVFFKCSEDKSSVIGEYKSIEYDLKEFAINIKENIHNYEILDYYHNNLKSINHQFEFTDIIK